MKILFATSEAFPLIKTGGLGDVSGSLPRALKALRQDVRLILPAYPAARERVARLRVMAELELPPFPGPVRILRGRLPSTRLPLYLVDAPLFFERAGDPYRAPDGRDWQDNALRFGLFAQAVVRAALNQAGLDWQPDVVHCNDWQTGLVPALLAAHDERPGTLFTIHNLAYQGLFPPQTLAELGLDSGLWHIDGLEFHGQLSFIKGGLVFADHLTTVSPSYAEEIQTPRHGYGLEGLLAYRRDRLTGILNGIDYEEWNPQTDPYIHTPYSSDTLEQKLSNKHALQEAFGLPVRARTPLFAFIGRLVEQKGVDLLLDAVLPLLAQEDLQLVILGTGEAALERRVRDLIATFPDRVAGHIGYSEGHAHLVEAGADLFVMPSRFEPCGLNQMYSLRYGTPPVVRRTGGLADTVVDSTPATLKDGTATGFSFELDDPLALREALQRALKLYARPAAWRRLMQQGMIRDFSWQRSARAYRDLYKSLIRQPH
ncbi:MAG TPA: glycogen synthase GlgA [Thioalkalivibrio sp.]|nr:glycogen synthase GlgA [Thioalkalivibrio sp.]